ncbi:MAG: dihydropteroate synthase [Bacteroidetes bacterium]|nr:MAG: dihydropteroate synthase [Bacteroidota bacterium]
MFEFQGKVIRHDKPLVMGILNITPDSFYAASRVKSISDLLIKAGLMLEQGADILDIGAISTRPGAKDITEEEELNRLLPSVQAVCSHFPEALVSVDTYRSIIAMRMIEEGATLINDISGGTYDPEMAEMIGKQNIPYIMMHVHSKPDIMQNEPLDAEAFETVKKFFIRQTAIFESKGAHQLILDPGFGFGKTLKANYDILNRLKELRVNNYPLLAGLSRKSMIYKHLNLEPSEALNGTTALNAFALQNGASILRVHDVKEAIETVKLFKMLRNHY